MKTVKTDRSRVEIFQRCPRSRWLAYHESGLGISSIRTPLPLAVGKAVHAGLAELLRDASTHPATFATMPRSVEDCAVIGALGEFRRDTVELDVMELAQVPNASAESDPALAELVGRGKSQFDRYLADEQASLVEGLIRAYARRRLRPLLEQFEVLEVEREGEWQLSQWGGETKPGAVVPCADPRYPTRGEIEAADAIQSSYSLWFMSRPDALLRERDTNQLYLLSYKTAASWDVRKARDAEHDMQGLSEGVEIERRLARWWELIHNNLEVGSPEWDQNAVLIYQLVDCSQAMRAFLHSLDSPPRIHAIRYEYMLKGDRWKDKDLTSRFGFEARAQRSVLVRGYMSAGMASGDEQWCHSWDYLKDGGTGETSKLNYRGWKSEPVWPHMSIARWIDLLDDSAMAISGDTGAELGYKSDAQAIGYTATHPLDDVFIPPIVIYRSDDDLRDWIEQVESQERRVAESVAELESCADEDSRRSVLNRAFPQTRRACSYPTECVFTRICYGGAEIRANPIESGLYKPRVVNHPQELSR